MDSNATSRPVAWQPLTFGGVAAFSQAPAGRLVLAQFVVALSTAACAVFFFQSGWNPAIEAAIDQLPGQGEIRDGALVWTGPAPVRLAGNVFLAFAVDPARTGELGRSADLECVFTAEELRIQSLFGYVPIPYPSGWVIAFNRAELKPWWGAWHPAVLAALILGAMVELFVSWWGLAALYAFPARGLAFYADRELTLRGAWKLSGAALLPGALFMNAAILAYALHRLTLLQLLAAGVAHFAVGWVFALAAIARLPKLAGASGNTIRPKNPFAPAPPA